MQPVVTEVFCLISATRPTLTGWEVVVMETGQDWRQEGGRDIKIRRGQIAMVGVN